VALLKGRNASAQAASREAAIFAKKNKEQEQTHTFLLKMSASRFFFFFQRTLMKLNFRICQDIDNKHDPKSDVHD